MRLLSFVLLISGFLTYSCAVITPSQVAMVNNLAVVSDSISVAPARIFEQLAEVRKERGLYYAASISSARARYLEIDALAEAAIADDQAVKRMNLYVDVLNSFLRSLRSISNDIRWEGAGREIRGVGRNIDSLVIAWNKLNPGDPVETGIAKHTGKSVAYVVEELTKRRQAIIVREFVRQGDTLVSACCDMLINLLRKKEVNELILNEEAGLEANYKAYLDAMELSRTFPLIENDRRYLALKKEIYDAKEMRNKCITSLRSLKNAHSKLLTELQERKKINQVYQELLELNQQAFELMTLLK
ncbi:MAG TPA: hypothetical protein VHO50_07475 [Bacteroidales bacterium]|nr:hypothetical protein [Bacteroidales bacterium]